MILMNKRLLPESSKILLELPLTQPGDLEHFEIASGNWFITPDGLVGEYPQNGGGMLYSKLDAPGDIMMGFYGEMLAPSDHDLNFVFCSEGYNAPKQDAGAGYIGGINGWWTKKTGIEKYPSCTPSAQTPLFCAESGRKYHIQTGCVQGQCFLFVNGQLILEMLDPTPETLQNFGRFGFGAYCSRNRYSNLTVYQIAWEPYLLSYQEQ